jgi:hypothetical protein
MKYAFWILFAVSILGVSVMPFHMPPGKIPHFSDNWNQRYSFATLDRWIETDSVYEIGQFYIIMWGMPLSITVIIFVFAHLVIPNVPPNTVQYNDPIGTGLSAVIIGYWVRWKKLAEYWNKPENLPKFKDRICSFLYEIGSLSLLFYLFLVVDVILTGRMEQPAFGNEIPIAIGILLIVVAVSVIRLLLNIQIPKNHHE